MCIVIIFVRQNRLDIGSHFDEAVFRTLVEQRQTAAFRIVFGRDNHLDGAGERADRLDEFGLFIAEHGLDLFALCTARLPMSWTTTGR